jgi:hypothetical protein
LPNKLGKLDKTEENSSKINAATANYGIQKRAATINKAVLR